MRFFFLIFIYILLSTTNLKSENSPIIIKNLVSVNNELITNIDLQNEINMYEFLEKTKLETKEYATMLNFLVEKKVKELEVEKRNIQINGRLINEKITNINKQLDSLKIEKNKKENIIKFLKHKITLDYKWNMLIFMTYNNSLGLNLNEINEKYKNENKFINEDMFKNETNVKLQSLSKTHYNKIKNSYLIKKFK